MLIRSVKLQNFRCFNHYQLSLAPRFSVFIGDNGSGKTAVLDALAVAAGCFLLGIPRAPARSIHPMTSERSISCWDSRSSFSIDLGPCSFHFQGRSGRRRHR
jgi:AAA15 family ATPase/GTPase